MMYIEQPCKKPKKKSSNLKNWLFLTCKSCLLDLICQVMWLAKIITESCKVNFKSGSASVLSKPIICHWVVDTHKPIFSKKLTKLPCLRGEGGNNTQTPPLPLRGLNVIMWPQFINLHTHKVSMLIDFQTLSGFS